MRHVAFQELILAGILEYMIVAIVGGAIVGLFTSAMYLHLTRKTPRSS